MCTTSFKLKNFKGWNWHFWERKIIHPAANSKKKLLIHNIDFIFCEAKFFLKLHYSLDHTTLLWMIIIHTWDFHWLLLNEEDFGLQNLASLVLSDQSVAQCIFLCRHPCPLKTKREREGVLCTYYLLYKEATFSK